MFNPRSPKEMFIQVLDDAALETVVGGSEFNTDGVSAPEFGSGSTTPYTPGSGGGSSGGGGDGGSYGSGGDGGGGDGGGGDGGGGGGSSGGDSG